MTLLDKHGVEFVLVPKVATAEMEEALLAVTDYTTSQEILDMALQAAPPFEPAAEMIRGVVIAFMKATMDVKPIDLEGLTLDEVIEYGFTEDTEGLDAAKHIATAILAHLFGRG